MTQRTRTAVVCSVADQAVAALTNIAVLVVAARLSSAADFAVFSIVYMVFTVLLGIETSYVGQALVLERDDPAGGRGVREACRSAVAFTALASSAVGGAAALVLAALSGEVAGGLLALGLVLPVVLVQDTVRYCFSTLRLPQYALASDALRCAVVVPALAVQPEGSSAARLVAVWGLTALPALLLGLALLAPRVRGAVTDWRRYLRRGHLGRRFVVEFAVGNGSSQLAVVGLGLFASQLAVGALRGAVTLYGPMNVLYNSATSFGPPLLNRVAGPRRKVRATAALAALLSGTAAVWTTVLVLLPERAGREILGDTWSAASGLLPATGSQYAAIAAGTSALLTLRVLAPRATLPIQVVFSLASVGFLLCGYAVGGVLGAAWGLVVGSGLKAVALWLRAGREARGAEGGSGAVEAAGASGGRGV
ncbi:hypothetical protein AB0M28_14580 [Streptomyces sp. NPDC051940]|uniref:hypothetical protein n=1 Tax=Streptomyces sp. NPDC051940 TaxID=3155675 RepID=UPI00343C9ED1